MSTGDSIRFTGPGDRADIEAGAYNEEGVSAILVNPAGQVLLMLRDDIPAVCHPGHWAPPGGGMEPGESR